MPRLNDEIYIRILEMAVEETPPGCDWHVPQETLVACMRVSKSFNIITGPVLYRRASVVDFPALLKGLRIPRAVSHTGGEEVEAQARPKATSLSLGVSLKRANRPQDRPTKLKLLGFIERLDLPHPPRGLSRRYTTADPHDPERVKAATDRWHARTRKRWSEALLLLSSMQAQSESQLQTSEGGQPQPQLQQVDVFRRLRCIWIGGLSELLPWRQYSEPSDLWKIRMMMATRIPADWIPHDWPITVGSHRPLVPLLASVARLDTVCDITAHKTLGWSFASYRASPTPSPPPPLLGAYARPETFIAHYATPVFAWSLRDMGMGRDVSRNLLPILPGIKNIVYCLVDAVDDTRYEYAPLTRRVRDEVAAGLYRAFRCTMDSWAAMGCEDLVENTSVTIYGMLGAWNVPPHCLTEDEMVIEAEAAQSDGPGGILLSDIDTRHVGDEREDPVYYSEATALRAVHAAFACANSMGGKRKEGIADRIRLLPARLSIEQPCKLCGMGCWEI